VHLLVRCKSVTRDLLFSNGSLVKLRPGGGRKFLLSVFHITFTHPTGSILCSVSKQRLAKSELSVSDYAISYLDFNFLGGWAGCWRGGGVLV
jgi:hypothetical protein